eukprot:2910394-Ditylum_brightwellii.AAC.1
MKDRRCLSEEEHLTCAIMNTAAKKLERLSPHKGTRRIISTYVTGFDNTYKERNDGQGQSTLVKRLNSANTGSLYLLMLRITKYTVIVPLEAESLL